MRKIMDGREHSALSPEDGKRRCAFRLDEADGMRRRWHSLQVCLSNRVQTIMMLMLVGGM